MQHDLTQLAMDSRVGELIRKSPLVCLPGTPLQTVFEAMDREKAGSMLVANTEGRLSGILTRYDLISRVILARKSLSASIAEVMTPDPVTVSADAGVLEAMLLMARHKVRHLPVLQGGFLVGLVSERDLFLFQRASLRILSSTIDQSESLADLKHCTTEVLALARRLLAQGVAATSLARLVSHLNDSLTQRVITLVGREMDKALGPLPRWCWLALGSEGREEQTVATDQDNAIIFEGDAAEYRPRFLRLAREINQGLAEIGFPLCKGGVMAMNEKWCKSANEWRSALSGWISRPEPQSLLDANIFFDFRGLYGETALAVDLRQWLTKELSGQRLFIRALAQDAMREEVGTLTRNTVLISIARALRRRGHKVHWVAPAEFEMKRHATAPVVYFARVLALTVETPATSTDGRLAAIAEKGAMSQSESQQMREAFNTLQRYRLRAQLDYAALTEQEKARSPSPNVLALDTLSIHEQERLSEALSSLGDLRAKLEMEFLR